jgi:hypothetical protein
VSAPLSLEDQHAVHNAEPWYPWKPEGQDQPHTISGELVKIDSVWSDYHEGFRVLAVLREPGGKCWSIRTYPTRLHDEWLRAAPQIGELTSPAFTGMLARKKDGKSYPDFSVAVERDGPPPAFDYARVGGEPKDGGGPVSVLPADAEVTGTAKRWASETAEADAALEAKTEKGADSDAIPF